MIYFTYKLKWVGGNGYQPEFLTGKTANLGHLPQTDGTRVGYAAESVASLFSEQTISDQSVTEITQADAIALATSAGYLDPFVASDETICPGRLL